MGLFEDLKKKISSGAKSFEKYFIPAIEKSFKPAADVATGAYQEALSLMSPGVAGTGNEVNGVLPTVPKNVPQYNQGARNAFAVSGVQNKPAQVGAFVTNAFNVINPVARSAVLGNNISTAFDQQDPGLAARSLGNFALNSLTGLNKLKVLERAPVIPKLVGYSTLRGTENAAIGQGNSLVNNGKFDTSRILPDFATGAAANAVLSPKLSYKAAKEAGSIVANDARNMSNELKTTGTVKRSAFIDVSGKVKPIAAAEDLSAIRGQIREGGKIKTPLKVKGAVQDAETMLYDRFAPVKRLEQGRTLKPSETPTTLIKRATGSDSIANAKIEFELSPILKTVGGDLTNLDTLMVAERMGELSAQGRSANPGNALAQLQAEIGTERFSKLQETATALRAYQDKYLQEWKSVGGLSEESYAAIKNANQKYAPFQRVMDDIEKVGFGGSKSLNSATDPIKKLTGSDRAIESPLESIVQNSYRMQKAIEKNRAMTALVNLGEDAGITKLKGSATGKSTLNVFENGKKATYEVPKDVADAVKGLDEEQLNMVVNVMSAPARLLRAGATGFNAGFAVPNVIRDQLTAAVNSKYGGIPIYDFISGLTSVLKKDESYQKWLLSGADMATFAAQDRGVVRRTLKEAVNNKRSIGKFVRNPLELARTIGEYSEKGSRVGVFKRAEKGAAKAGMQGFDVQLAAGREAREATVDFAQRGSKMKAANSLIPFLNARIQGTGKLLQSFKQRPVQTGLIGTAIGVLPAATLYAYNTSDPKRAAIYDEIPDYITNDNFILVTGNKDVPFIKIPKGEIGRIFGNPTEHFMGYLRGSDQQSFAEMSTSLLVSLSPIQGVNDMIPTAASVPLQIQSNYDTFRQQNIVSPYQKDLPPELQFNKNTTETAKFLGNATGMSPAKIEFGIRGVGAGVAGQALQASDAAFFGKFPETTALPIIDRFAGENKDLSKTASKIYAAEDKLRQENAGKNYQAKELIKKGITTGNSDFFTQAAALNPESFKEFYTSVSKDLSKNDMSPTDKAVQSLSKARQAEVMKQLESDGKVSSPEVSSYKAPVSGVETAMAAEGSGTKSRAATEADKAKAKIEVTYGNKERVQVGDLLYVKDDSVEAGYKQYNLKTIAKAAESQKLVNDIEKAKRDDDYGKWVGLQEQKYNGLIAKITNADPVLDQANVITWQNQADDILNTVKTTKKFGNSFKNGAGAAASKQTAYDTASYSLQSDNLVRAGDVRGYLTLSAGRLNALQSKLAATSDATKQLSLQNQIGDLQVKMQKIVFQGGFTKPKTASIGIRKAPKPAAAKRSLAMPKIASQKLKSVTPKGGTSAKRRIRKSVV